MQTHTDTMRGQPAKEATQSKAADDFDTVDWKAELESRWQALGRKVFVVEPEQPPKLQEILDECAQLVVVWALARTRGNFTHAAMWFETSRKVVRRCFVAWRRINPDLIPMPFAVFLRWSERHGGKRR